MCKLVGQSCVNSPVVRQASEVQELENLTEKQLLTLRNLGERGGTRTHDLMIKSHSCIDGFQ